MKITERTLGPKLIGLIRQGHTLASAGAWLGLDEAAIVAWSRRHPEFYRALNAERAKRPAAEPPVQASTPAPAPAPRPPQSPQGAHFQDPPPGAPPAPRSPLPPRARLTPQPLPPAPTPPADAAASAGASKYHEGRAAEMLALMRHGASVPEVCAAMGIHKSTFYRWRDSYPEFREAVALGETYAQAWWDTQGRYHLRAEGPFNTTLWIATMNNRFGWRDQRRVEVPSLEVLLGEIANANRGTRDVIRAHEPDPSPALDPERARPH